MTAGIGIVLAAVGAILRFAVADRVDGVDLSMIGTILIVAGLVAIVVGLIQYVAGRREIIHHD